jgi:uncharacterized membrane protein
VAEIADDAGTLWLVLALPSWDDYLQIALDDLIESGSRSPMVLLRARAMLSSLLSAAPPRESHRSPGGFAAPKNSRPELPGPLAQHERR